MVIEMQSNKTFAVCVALTFLIYLLGLNAVITNTNTPQVQSVQVVGESEGKKLAPDHTNKPHGATPISQKEQARLAKKQAYLWWHKKIDAPHKEWICAKKIIHLESRWIPNLWNAQGSTAYGLGQVKGSFHYTKNKPLKQFKVAVRYMIHKHQTPCLALAFHNRNGWY